MAAYSADFDGSIVAVDGSKVTYRVDRVRLADTERLPGRGGTVVVHYPEPEPDLVVGESYRVQGWNHRSEGIGSQIAFEFDGDCGSGAGTTALGGAYLGASSSGPPRRWPFVAVGFVTLGGALLAVPALVARSDRWRRSA